MNPPKIALVFAHAPSGHTAAAQAVAEELPKLKAEPVLIDLSTELFTHSGPAVSEIYYKSLKVCPLLWDLVYDSPVIDLLSSPFRRVLSRGKSAALVKFLKGKNITAAVCTHSMPTLLLAPEGEKGFPVYAVVTDFSAHRFWPDTGVRKYFVHSSETANSLLKRGIARKLICETGIPVRESFFANTTVPDTGEKLIVITGGSKGMGRIEDCVRAALSASNAKIAVLCGTNIKLSRKISRLAKTNPRLTAVTDYNSAPALIRSADIIIGKPGGVTAAEALALKKPFIIYAPLPGQEKLNAECMMKRNAALRADSPEELPWKINILLSGGAKLAFPADFSKPSAARAIAAEIIETIS
ncbi:MAG: glycosyltransferase [Elusimicrobiaceae bacterium]